MTIHPTLKANISSIATVFILLLFFRGIYRNDTPIELYLEFGKKPQFDNLVKVLLNKNGWMQAGSAVLIDSVTILSAAHVFCDDIKKDTVVNYQGHKIKTYIAKGQTIRPVDDFGFMIGHKIYIASKIIVHPLYLKERACDIVVVKLRKPVQGTRTLELNDTFDELGDTLSGAGFGASGPADMPDLVKRYELRLGGQNIADSTGGLLIDGKPSIIFADFDAPDSRSGCNITGSPKPLPLEYMPGGGDSGGPAFIKRNNKYVLAGICTNAENKISTLLTHGYYCQIFGWTRVSVFRRWIVECK